MDLLQLASDFANRPGVLQLFFGLVVLLFAREFAEAQAMFGGDRELRFQSVVVRLVGAFCVLAGGLQLVGVIHS